jgi:transcriptional regulator with XRE-family HTH domain
MSDTGPSAPLSGSERTWLGEVGMRIRLARVRSGESQRELGGRSGVSRVTVGSIERGDHVAALTAYRRMA